ncbi:MAG: hypothetical protein ACRD0K_14220 [Egibacteraceae bacterium]
MSPVRPLELDDIPEVASLYEAVSRSGSRTPPPRLAQYFARTFLDHPWVDPQIPSLVFETGDGRIGAFIGSHVRALRFNGRRIRVGCSGQLVSDPAAGGRGAGALLLRRYLCGPQDLTITDGATPQVRQMWEQLGGSTSFFSSLSWTRFFRPFRFAGDHLLERRGGASWRPLLRPLSSALDGLAARACGPLLRMARPPTRGEQLTPQALLEHLPSVAGRLRVRPDYDEESLRWLFQEAARVATRGDLARQLVRDHNGRALGWYVAYLRPGGVGHVLQIAARDRDVAAVIDHLFHHAWRSGATALRGRCEPLLFTPLRQRHCHLRHDALVLVHSRDASLVHAVLTGDGLVTRMEGEWWMGHHIEPFA